MSREKFTFVQQKRSILKNIPKVKNNGVIQAGIGDDYGRLKLLREKTDDSCGAFSEMAVTEGLCLQNACGYVRTDVIKLYNKLKAGGYTPVALSDTLMINEPDEKKMKKILKELCDVADELGLDILYGHTECSSAFSAPAVSVTMYGTGEGYFEDFGVVTGRGETCIKSSCVKPGMDIVMCGQTGILGTILRVTEKKDELLKRYSEEYLRTAEAFEDLLIVRDEAYIAQKCSVVKSHHISTGGVYAALWELAENCDLGLNICHDNIPIMQETIEICEFMGDNPYMIDGCGAILFVTEDGEALSEALYAAGYESSTIGKLTLEKKRVITHDGEVRYLTPPLYRTEWRSSTC